MTATLLAVLFSALAVPLFGWADRKIGGDDPNPKSTGFGRVGIYAALCLGLAHVARAPVLWTLGEMAVVWAVYRSLPWKVGGSTTPRTQSEIFASFLRNGMPAMGYGALAVAGGYRGWVPPLTVWPVFFLLGFALFATEQSVNFARIVDNTNSEDVVRNANEKVETNRGIAFGICLSFVGLALAVIDVLPPL